MCEVEHWLLSDYAQLRHLFRRVAEHPCLFIKHFAFKKDTGMYTGSADFARTTVPYDSPVLSLNYLTTQTMQVKKWHALCSVLFFWGRGTT